MSNQNSATATRMTPDEVCELFGIKKAAYYERLKFLGIKAEKDESGKAHLTEEQVNLLEQLDNHIKTTGKMDGFSGGGQLTIATEPNALAFEVPVAETDYSDPDSGDTDDLFRQAAELKAQSLVMPDLIKLHLANQMSIEDLPPDLREKVESVRAASSPKANPAQVASQLLAKYRNRGGNQPAIAS